MIKAGRKTAAERGARKIRAIACKPQFCNKIQHKGSHRRNHICLQTRSGDNDVPTARHVACVTRIAASGRKRAWVCAWVSVRTHHRKHCICTLSMMHVSVECDRGVEYNRSCVRPRLELSKHTHVQQHTHLNISAGDTPSHIQNAKHLS